MINTYSYSLCVGNVDPKPRTDTAICEENGLFRVVESSLTPHNDASGNLRSVKALISSPGSVVVDSQYSY
ncbi:MAG: hypothetical protein ACR2Q3_02070 [Woeseiaceae bacterium]